MNQKYDSQEQEAMGQKERERLTETFERHQRQYDQEQAWARKQLEGEKDLAEVARGAVGAAAATTPRCSLGANSQYSTVSIGRRLGTVENQNWNVPCA